MNNTETSALVTKSAGVTIESNREAQEIQALFMIANSQPRDTERCLDEMVLLCQNRDLVENNIYSYKRGSTLIEGLGIPVIEQLGLIWGRCKWGFKVINQTEAYAEVKCFAFDYQQLVPVERTIRVANEYKADDKIKKLTDERDIREHIANIANRSVRVCVETIIGRHNIKRLLNVAKTTLAQDPKIKEANDKMISTFYEKFGVIKEMIEKYLGCSIQQMTAEQYVEMRGIYNSLKNNEAKAADFFDLSLMVDVQEKKQTEQKTTDQKPQDKPEGTRRGRGPNKPKDQPTQQETTEQAAETEKPSEPEQKQIELPPPAIKPAEETKDLSEWGFSD